MPVVRSKKHTLRCVQCRLPVIIQIFKQKEDFLQNYAEVYKMPKGRTKANLCYYSKVINAAQLILNAIEQEL